MERCLSATFQALAITGNIIFAARLKAFFYLLAGLISFLFVVIRKQVKNTAAQVCGCGDIYLQWDKTLYTLQKRMARLLYQVRFYILSTIKR